MGLAVSKTSSIIDLHIKGSPILNLKEPVRIYGCAAHPDHLLDMVHFSDKEYVHQLQKYKDTTGHDPLLEKCTRPQLLERIV